jgi:hypothetical protein
MNQQLERRYRWLLLAYPKTWRETNTDNMLATLDELSGPQQTRPGWRDTRGLIANGLRARTFASSGGSPRTAVADGAMRASLLWLCIWTGSVVGATFNSKVTVSGPPWARWLLLLPVVAFLARPSRWMLALLILAPVAMAALPQTASGIAPDLRWYGIVADLVSVLPIGFCALRARHVFTRRRLGWIGLIALSSLPSHGYIFGALLVFVLVTGLVGIGVLRLDPRPTATLITTIGFITVNRFALDMIGGALLVPLGYAAAAVAVTVALLAGLTRVSRPSFAT